MWQSQPYNVRFIVIQVWWDQQIRGWQSPEKQGYSSQMECLCQATPCRVTGRSTRASQEAEEGEENVSKRFIVGSTERNRWGRVSRFRIGQSWIWALGLWELSVTVWPLALEEYCSWVSEPYPRWVGRSMGFIWKVCSFTNSRNWLFLEGVVSPES